MSTTIGKSKISNKEATIRGLLACGCTETKRSSKYRTFDAPYTGDPAKTWLVGKSGALRVTRNTIANSLSRTGSIGHKAFRYVGRLHEVVGDGIDEYSYRDIWAAVVRGDIPVTKDGYHAEA